MKKIELMRYHYGLVIFIACLPMLVISQSAKHDSEFGIQYGNFTILGDVDHKLFPGWGASINYRKSLNAVVSLRPSVFYGVTYGLDAYPTTDNIHQEAALFEGYSTEQPWFFAYQCKLFRLHIQALFELSNLGPEKKESPFNYYLLLGAGVNSSGTWLNLHDENGIVYQDLLNRTEFNTTNDFNTSEGRKNIREVLQKVYDDTYETPAFKEVGKYRLGDETNIDFEFSAGLGIAYQLTPAVSISLEHEYIFIPSDYLDGNRWRTEQDATTKADIGQFTSLGFAFRLSPKRKAAPLHWVNPWLLQTAREDSLQAQLDSLYAAIGDDDQDGVINAMDEQPGSIPNCPVDVKGITSDLDRDGIPDCHDKFPFINKREIEDLITQAIEKDRQQIKELTTAVESQSEKLGAAKESLSAIIYFNSDSDEIQLPQLASIALAAKQISTQNITCITITGFADSSYETEYNLDLSKRRANQVALAIQEYFGHSDIDIEVISYGEDNPLMMKGPTNLKNAINRRVEISGCEKTPGN